MLASGTGPRAAIEAPPPSEGPSAEDLKLPEHVIRDEGLRGLIMLVQRVQSLRVAVFGHFDDAFERLVTVGDADGYPACVERFKSRLAACDDDLERIAMRLYALQHPPVAAGVRSVIRAERARLDAKCDEQVTHHSSRITIAHHASLITDHTHHASLPTHHSPLITPRSLRTSRCCASA